MKKIVKSFALLAVAASALVSCKGELTTPEEKPQTGKFEYTFTLGAPETKALLASDSEGYFAQWEVDDQLGIYTLSDAGITNNTTADIDIEKDPVEFKVETSYALEEGSDVYAYFPYDAENSTAAAEDPSKVVLSIPASQTGSLNAMPMAAKPYAVTEPISVGTEPIADIKMRNLGSVLLFNVFSTNPAYVSETVKSILFRTSAICGEFKYDITKPELVDITGLEGNTVTVTKNITPGNDRNSGNTVPMVVAPNATDGYTGTIVVTTNVATYTYTISSPIKIDRSIIKKVNVDLGSHNAVREAFDGSFFYETFGVPAANTNVTDFAGWSEAGVTYSGNARVGSTSSNICNISGSSAGGYMYETSSNIYQFDVTGINTSKYENITLAINYKGNNTSAKWKIEYSENGTSYTSLATNISCTTTWQPYKSTANLPSCANLRLRITNTTASTYGIYFDDLKLYGEIAKQVTSVEVSGSPAKVKYVAGETFNPSGLTAIANFDDLSIKDVSSEVTWTDESGNSFGALSAGTTSVAIKAVFKGVSSEVYTVSGLTVSEPVGGDYKLVEANLSDWRGDYLIAYSDVVFMNGSLAGGTSGVGAASSSVSPGTNLSADKKTVAQAWGDQYYVTIEAIEDTDLSKGYVIKTHSSTTPYFYQTSNNNGMAATDNKNTAANYPITVNFVSSSDIQLKLGGGAAGAILHYNATDSGKMFRYYKNGGQSKIYLYKKQ